MHHTSAKMQQPVPEASRSELTEQLKEEECAVKEIHSTESDSEASGSGLIELRKEEECGDKEIHLMESVPEASESGLIELLKEEEFTDEEIHFTESVPEASASGLTNLLKEEEFTDEEIHLTDSEYEASGSGLTELLKEEEFTDKGIHLMESDSEASELGLTELLKEEEECAVKEIHLTDDKNKMPELPKCPDCSSFIAFYLEGNYEPTAIPPLFFHRMALLQVLDLSRTGIKSLPKSLPKLVALKKLLLQGCDLFMELSPQVGELKNLEELDLDETQIMDLPIETQLTEDRGVLETSVENEEQQLEWKNQPDYLVRIPDPINNEKDMMTHLAEDSEILEITIENEGQQPDNEKDEMIQLAEDKDLPETPTENECRQDEEKDVMPQLAEDRDQLEATIESKGQQSELVNVPDYSSPINNDGKDAMTILVEDKDLETTIENEGQQPDNKKHVMTRLAEDGDREIIETVIEIEGQQPGGGKLLEVQDHNAQCSDYSEEGATETNVIIKRPTPSVTIVSPTSEQKISKGSMNLLSLFWKRFRHVKGNNHKTKGVLGGGKDGYWNQDIGKYGSGDFSMTMIQANNLNEDQCQIECGQYGTFVGIYDGHGGPEAARYVCDHLYEHFLAITAKSQGVVTTKTIESAFSETENGFTTLVSNSWSTKPQMASVGTSCLVGVIYKQTLFIANLGDSRVVLGKKVGRTEKMTAFQLSTEHIASVEAIRQELKELHPHDPEIVVLKRGVWRVKGIIQVSRSIGDVYMKHPQFHKEPIHTKFRLREPMKMPILRADPTIVCLELQPNDSFLIFASDGLWEFLSNEKAVEIVQSHPRAGSARRLVKAALQEAAKKQDMKYSDLQKIGKGVRRHFHDDITVIVLFFNRDLISKGAVQDHPVSIRSA